MVNTPVVFPTVKPYKGFVDVDVTLPWYIHEVEAEMLQKPTEPAFNTVIDQKQSPVKSKKSAKPRKQAVNLSTLPLFQ
jgi:hypothetical protein